PCRPDHRRHSARPWPAACYEGRGLAGECPAADDLVGAYACQRRLPIRHNIGPWTTAPHGPTRGTRGDGHHPTARDQPDGALLPQQLRGYARGGARPLRRLVRARGPAQSAAELAADSFVERTRRRSRVCDGGRAARAAGVPPKGPGLIMPISAYGPLDGL